jgi:ubiquinone/menaquinone biosynthesis C-methylase UbiE
MKDFVQRTLRGERHLPPWWLRDVGGADFEATGQEFLDIFVDLANLQPDETVLDIGCGSGWMAFPLTGYLNSEGSYYGLDVVEDSIKWCRKHLGGQFPDFQFLHADLYNERYNPQGEVLARNYTFPFDDNSFDFVFLISVFSHLLPVDTRNYLGEVSRLLRPTGRTLMTFFLLNETQRQLAEQGRNDIPFKYGPGSYRLRNEAAPESAVAYDELFLRQLITQYGLRIEEPIHYGTWSGRPEGRSYQDIVLVRPAR